jgi:hypothetical protein
MRNLGIGPNTYIYPDALKRAGYVARWPAI